MNFDLCIKIAWSMCVGGWICWVGWEVGRRIKRKKEKNE